MPDLDKALLERLRMRWLDAAKRTREAHVRDFKSGQIGTVDDAIRGALGNALQNVIGDLHSLIEGYDPTQDESKD